MNNKKPPVGIKPTNLWLEERKDELIYAISRYINANKIIPVKWIKEYNKIIKWEEELK